MQRAAAYSVVPEPLAVPINNGSSETPAANADFVVFYYGERLELVLDVAP